MKIGRYKNIMRGVTGSKSEHESFFNEREVIENNQRQNILRGKKKIKK